MNRWIIESIKFKRIRKKVHVVRYFCFCIYRAKHQRLIEMLFSHHRVWISNGNVEYISTNAAPTCTKPCVSCLSSSAGCHSSLSEREGGYQAELEISHFINKSSVFLFFPSPPTSYTFRSSALPNDRPHHGGCWPLSSRPETHLHIHKTT